MKIGKALVIVSSLVLGVMAVDQRVLAEIEQLEEVELAKTVRANLHAGACNACVKKDGHWSFAHACMLDADKNKPFTLEEKKCFAAYCKLPKGKKSHVGMKAITCAAFKHIK